MYHSLQYIIFTPCNATVLNVILYCNIGWCIKDGAVQHSRQQWLIACRSQMVRLGVTVRVRVKKKSASLPDLSLFTKMGLVHGD